MSSHRPPAAQVRLAKKLASNPGAILCGDNGLIHGWEESPWDRQHGAGAVSTEPSPGTTP